MAYCRFGEDGSDVYLAKVDDGLWECYSCKLTEAARDSSSYDSLAKVEAHLEAHIHAGHVVPKSAIVRIALEMDSEDEDS